MSNKTTCSRPHTDATYKTIDPEFPFLGELVNSSGAKIAPPPQWAASLNNMSDVISAGAGDGSKTFIPILAKYGLRGDRYPSVAGELEVIKASAYFLEKGIGLREGTSGNVGFDRKSITCTIGIRQAIALFFSGLSFIYKNPSLLLGSITWNGYEHIAMTYGGVSVVKIAGRNKIFAADLRQAFYENENIRAVIITNPGNPHGDYKIEEFEEIAEVIKTRELTTGITTIVFVDGAYASIVPKYPDPFETSLGKYCVASYGISKFGNPGARFGVSVISNNANQDAIMMLAYFKIALVTTIVSIPKISEEVLDLLRSKKLPEIAKEIKNELDERGRKMTELLSSCDIKSQLSLGSYYISFDVKETLGFTGDQFVEHMKIHGVILTSSSAFGQDSWVRFCLAAPSGSDFFVVLKRLEQGINAIMLRSS